MPQRLIAVVLLSALLARVPASAQDAGAAATDAAAGAPLQPAEALSAPPAPSTSGAAPASTPPLALGPTEVAWEELRAIQLRHEQIWRERDSRVALPAVGIAVGLAAFSVMLPFGSILVADANYAYDGAEYAQRDRAVGGTLIAFGILGFAALVAGSVAIALKRKRRASQDSEMKSLADRRTLLENLLEADWRARQSPKAP
ncbi:MAG TPA: hypothetical protein VFZ61_01470 [Polyangiales bacterium]